MKKTITGLFVVLVALLSQAAIAADGSRFYGGLGAVEMTNQGGMAMTPFESGYASNPSAHRSEDNRSFSGDAFVGYKLSNNLAVEVGYIGSGSGFTSETSGTNQWIIPVFSPSNDVQIGTETSSVPFSITQSKKLTAWHLSLVGEHPLDGSVKLLGRIGLMQVNTDWDQRITNNCPASMGCDNTQFQGWATSSSKTAALLGAGVVMKVTNTINLRAELLKSSALPSVAQRVDLVFDF